jgi:hypothetical protein
VKAKEWIQSGQSKYFFLGRASDRNAQCSPDRIGFISLSHEIFKFLTQAHICKRKLQEQSERIDNKAKEDDCVTKEETLSSIEEGKLLKCDEGYEKVMHHDVEGEHADVREEEFVPSSSAVFANYAAGALKS